MKISPISASCLATLALLCASTFTVGQQLQRSMVYHAAPQQSAPQTSTGSSTSVVSRTQNAQVTSTRRQASSSTQTSSPIVVKTAHTAPADTASINTTPRAVPSRNATPAKSSAAPTVSKAEAVAKVEPRASTSAVAPALRSMDNKRAPAFGKKFDRWFYVSSAVFAAGAILDHTSTSAGMKKAGAREANPLLRNSDGGFSAGKHLALTAGIYGASFMLQKKHPRMATALRLVGGFAKIGVSLHNINAARGRADALPR